MRKWLMSWVNLQDDFAEKFFKRKGKHYWQGLLPLLLFLQSKFQLRDTKRHDRLDQRDVKRSQCLLPSSLSHTLILGSCLDCFCLGPLGQGWAGLYSSLFFYPLSVNVAIENDKWCLSPVMIRNYWIIIYSVELIMHKSTNDNKLFSHELTRLN